MQLLVTVTVTDDMRKQPEPSRDSVGCGHQGCGAARPPTTPAEHKNPLKRAQG
ncbi:hypothetical protein M440DRAFT_1405957 [Trichoderma longibrachiatum ATCC 18648]|uniref:Uncharacterized protein n=1 Tax=Trichoderma longibrachiatum ATCC 18648 TaxID=983965 RepID=A0A2T4BRH8_TRILO|nr:hypothetical protein M440DRAFT_1405957 [Trichoderma longibrachiatum ATCC 18648]